MKKYLLWLGCLLFLNNAGAHDPVLTQTLSNMSYLNPAAAGIFYQPFIKGFYRNQWQGIDVTTALDYEQYLDAVKGGIGLRLLEDADGLLDNSSASLQYSHLFKTGNDFKLLAGAEFSFVKNKVHAYADTGNTERPGSIINYPNAGLGLLSSYKNVYLGISINNFFEPVNPLVGEPYNIRARRYGVQAGGFLPLSSDLEKGWLLHFGLTYIQQGFDSYLTPELEVSKGIITAGASVRSNQVTLLYASFMAGINVGRIKAGYSFEQTFFDIPWAHAHEISLYVFLGKKPTPESKNLHPLASSFRRML